MRRPVGAAIAAALILASVPAGSQPATTVHTPTERDAVLVFVGRLGDALNVQIEGMKKLAEIGPLLQSLATPSAIKANAPKLRALLAEAREAVARSDAMLARIETPNVLIGGITPAQKIAEVRAQSAKGTTLLNDVETFLAAAERDDRQTVRKVIPKVMDGAFVLMDGNATLYRTRQAGFPAAESTHQLLEIGEQLYSMMAEAGRAWLAVKLGGRGEAAAGILRARLTDAASRLRASSRDGKANLARELGEFDRSVARGSPRGEEAAIAARLRRALEGRAALFALGDELADLAQSEAATSAASLAAQPDPLLLGRIAAIELRFQQSLIEQGQIASGNIR
ncbi:MAG: hypothetical protein QOJ91_155 [Sphingomonadales bacterium]|nr:hypothetical protein [Sphingomonadales bacterium]